ncbi:hypothetical protein HCN73_06905 [Lactobacillus crispatus]|uniref:hypothetical protein n=1 Tax=Lactobacillus crispatus TaxID=47770 RepID=UPI0015EC6289|nr:hypothetical protein [Lactobacillus crispatus]MBA2916063.1 hypothetical protein [Lactobacillus crispatus]
MLVIGIICLVVAAISYFKYLSEKNGQANQKQAENEENEAKWQRTLAIIFLVFGILLIGYWIALR